MLGVPTCILCSGHISLWP